MLLFRQSTVTYLNCNLTKVKLWQIQKCKNSLCVHCSYEQAHFTVALSGKTGLWWIGLRAHGGMGGGVDYIWDNGLPITFTHWDRDQPGRNLKITLKLDGQDNIYTS